MLEPERERRRKAALSRPLDRTGDALPRCCVLECRRLPSIRSGNGISQLYCRYHTQHKARHGSHWHGTYRAAEIAPYVKAASQWLRENRTMVAVGAVRWDIEHQLNRISRVAPAMNLRGLSAERRASIAFARLRAADVAPERILAIFLGVSALIEDDWKSHNVREFRIVQAAKVMHRLASGTHRHWDVWNPRTGGTLPYDMHAYPRSSGIVLRKMGEIVEKACGNLSKTAVPEIIALKTQRFGLHPSHPPPSPQETRP
ncbi:Hypothetical protein NGAL_HAMBI2605_20430 [Neorhizobium galegae bv. orientalis]|nr:Hypothetical protein NGAL_HAMBI2605_20430 [Neorhizobium galegae bv. orientalis]